MSASVAAATRHGVPLVPGDRLNVQFGRLRV